MITHFFGDVVPAKGPVLPVEASTGGLITVEMDLVRPHPEGPNIQIGLELIRPQCQMCVDISILLQPDIVLHLVEVLVLAGVPGGHPALEVP